MSNDIVKRYFLTAGSDSEMLQHSEGAFVRASDHDREISQLEGVLQTEIMMYDAKVAELQTKIQQIKNALNNHALSSIKCLEIIREVVEKGEENK